MIIESRDTLAWHTPWPGPGQSKGFLNKQITGVGGLGGALAAPGLLCVMTQRESFKTLLWYSVILKQFVLLSMSRTQSWPWIARHDLLSWSRCLGTDIDITLCVNNQYGHALTQTLRLSDVLFSGSIQWRMKNDPRRTWPRLVADWRHPTLAFYSGFMMSSPVLYQDPQETLRNFSSIKRSWKYEDLTIEHSDRKWKFLIKLFTTKRCGRLHHCIFESCFLNLLILVAGCTKKYSFYLHNSIIRILI